MNAAILLHNAARHYCIDGAAKWRAQYADLCAKGLNQIPGTDGGFEYSPEAYRLFPKNLVFDAILHDVESLKATDFTSEEEIRPRLCLAGDTAESEFTRIENDVANTAMREERTAYRQFIAAATVEQCSRRPLLPFRRVLADAEHQELMSRFSARWGRWYGGDVDTPSSEENLTLHVAAMESPEAYSHLRRAILNIGCTRILELREHGHGYEMDVSTTDFTYNGAEGFWTAGDMDWMVYASHEASITFGGTGLIQRMRSCLPEFNRYIYKGWDLSAYAEKS
jgi:hypothetical protein